MNTPNSRWDDFIAIDFETATRAKESAVSIGLVQFRNFKPIASFYSLIQPPRLYIRPDFTEIHGLTLDDVKDVPTFGEIWDRAVNPFINGLPLAAHHARFDIGILKAILEWYGLEIPELRYFCTCTLARRIWPDFGSYSLGSLAEKFGIVYDAHNALDDAMTCGKLVRLAADKFGCVSVGDLLDVVDMKMNDI